MFIDSSMSKNSKKRNSTSSGCSGCRSSLMSSTSLSATSSASSLSKNIRKSFETNKELNHKNNQHARIKKNLKKKTNELIVFKQQLDARQTVQSIIDLKSSKSNRITKKKKKINHQYNHYQSGNSATSTIISNSSNRVYDENNCFNNQTKSSMNYKKSNVEDLLKVNKNLSSTRNVTATTARITPILTNSKSIINNETNLNSKNKKS